MTQKSSPQHIATLSLAMSSSTEQMAAVEETNTHWSWAKNSVFSKFFLDQWIFLSISYLERCILGLVDSVLQCWKATASSFAGLHRSPCRSHFAVGVSTNWSTKKEVKYLLISRCWKMCCDSDLWYVCNNFHGFLWMATALLPTDWTQGWLDSSYFLFSRTKFLVTFKWDKPCYRVLVCSMMRVFSV